MSKRVHEIAKEHDLPAREVLDRLREAGMNIKSASSGVEEDAALKVLGLKPKAAAEPPAPANGNGDARGSGAAGAGAGSGPAGGAGGNREAVKPARASSAAPAAKPRASGTQAPNAKPRSGGGDGAAAGTAGAKSRAAQPRSQAARPASAAPPAASPAPSSGSPSPSTGSAAPSTASAAPTPGAAAPTTGRPPIPRPSGSGPRRVVIDDSRGGGRSGSRPTSSRSGAPAPARPVPVPRPAGPIPTDPRAGRASAPVPRDPRAGTPAAAPRDTRAGTARDPRAGAARDPRAGGGARDPRGGSASRDPQAATPRAATPRDPRSGTPAVARDPRAGTPAARDTRGASGTRQAAPGAAGRGAAPAASATPAEAPPSGGSEAPVPVDPRSAGGDQKQRPTRDSLQGERAPGAGGGGRRRVVIDSQASRRAPGGGPSNQPPRRQRRGRRRRGVYDEEVESRATNALTADAPRDVVRINSGSTVKDVAEYLSVPVAEVMKKLISLGELKTVTQTLPDETIEVLASELDKQVEIVHTEDEVADEPVYEDAAEDLVDRPPVVTIMGHVDHGKTSLLDAIRETQVAAGEAGGITQHIGAYQVQHDGRTITFLDTPGHEAFTAMRARGARVTDLAVIVVAADDGVKPQTQEAVDHAKEAEVPVLVAVNKIDKEGADPARVRTEMTALGLQPVEWGGDIEFVDVSARTKEGLDNLLETIIVMAEVEELQANPSVEASGTVIESKLDPGRGPVVTILIERGTLKVGDALVAGANWGRVRAMNDFTGKRTAAARPGEPVEVLGFDGVPEAGEHVRVVDHERRARQLAAERATRLKSESLARRSNKKISLEDIAGGEVNELNLVVKADVAGSLEAIEDEIAKLPQEEVSVNVIRRAVGAVTESDVMLAAASEAVILAFNVRPVGDARAVAEREGIEIRHYAVIYRAIDDLRSAMEGMLAPEEVEESLGSAEVRQIFRASRVGTIAGSHVTEGKITRGSKVRLVRDGTVVYDGEIASLRRFNEDAREVNAGYECGVVLRDYADVKEGDVLEAYATRQVERELVS